jgi:hypothetical protein
MVNNDKTTPEKVGKFIRNARMHAMTKPRLRLFGLLVVACRCGATWTARIYLLPQALPLLPDTGTRGGRAGTDTVTPPRPPLDPSMNRQNRTDSQTRACDHATDAHGGLLMVVG